MLTDFLDNKPLYYAKIDYQRMPRIYAKIKHKIPKLKIIHVIGTNGKGSTGRFLALMLQYAGFLVGHYTSPHVLDFNERFWLDGNCVSKEILDKAHKSLLEILSNEDSDALSYFEYSTLLCPFIFQKCDFVILEAGLGGEYDATNVFDKRLSIVTSIGYDHQDFLGYDLKSITTTKLNSISTTTILAEQNEQIVTQIAKKIAFKKNVDLKEVILFDDEKIEKYCKKYNYPDFLKQNLITALNALEYLDIKIDLSLLKPLDLIGRFQKIRKNITLDVGHNLLSAKEIVKCFEEKSLVLIYNSYNDKDIFSILSTLKPIIKEVEICFLKSEDRQIGEEKAIEALKILKLKWKYFEGNISEEKEYLVFGSFYVAESFLKRINEK